MAAACDKIIDAAKATEASISGPVPLPTKRRIYCVLRSPHVNKDSREHFETRTHHRLIDVHQPTAQTIDALMGLELPAGVEIEVKLSERGRRRLLGEGGVEFFFRRASRRPRRRSRRPRGGFC